jgi:hypothetical protein
LQRKYNHGDVFADIPIGQRVPGGTQLLEPDKAKVRPYGDGSFTPGGYIKVRRPGHPLARADGRVLIHRANLYDKIGPGTHPCCWCGVPVTWGVDQWKGSVAGRLIADHLNGDVTDNRPENLVPSCQSCNAKRARGVAL